MKLLLAVLLVATIAVSTVFADDDDMFAAEPGVTIITSENYNDFIGKDKAVLIAAKAPWCGWCKRLSPTFKQLGAANAAAGNPVIVAKVNAEKERDIANKLGVSGFPTLKFFAAGTDVPIEYSGERDLKAFLNFINDKVPTAGLVDPAETPIKVEQIENQEALESKCLNKLLCVVYFLPHVAFTGAAGRNKQIDLLGKIASKFRDNNNVAFGWLSGGEHEKFEQAFGVSENYPAMVGINKDKLKYTAYNGLFEAEPISAYINKLLIGRQSMAVLRGATELPKLSKGVALWDGKDYVESD